MNDATYKYDTVYGTIIAVVKRVRNKDYNYKTSIKAGRNFIAQIRHDKFMTSKDLPSYFDVYSEIDRFDPDLEIMLN